MLFSRIFDGLFNRKRNVESHRVRGIIKPTVLIGHYTENDLADIIQAIPIHRLSDSRSLAAAGVIAGLVRTHLASCTLDLVKASFVPAPNLAIGGLTIADFTGYTQVTVVSPAAAFIDLVNGGWSIAIPGTFTCSGTAISNTIYGYVLQDSVPNIWQSGLLPSPLSVSQAGQAIPITVLVNEKP